MKVSTKYTIEAVLAIGAAYTLSQFLSNSTYDVEQRLQTMAIAAVLLSALMMALMSMRYIFAVTRAYFPIREQSYAVRKQSELRIAQAPETVFQRLHHELTHQANWKLLQAKPEQGYLKYRTKLRWQSWGEVVTVQIEALEEAEAYVRITSVSLHPEQPVDNSNNQHNVSRIEHFLRQVAA